MRDDESSGSDYASESEEEIDEREFTCENVRVRARARGKGVKSSAESARGGTRRSNRRGVGGLKTREDARERGCVIRGGSRGREPARARE